MLVRLVEIAGAVVIFIGAAYAFFRFGLAALSKEGSRRFFPVRLTLGRFLALGLEFQLAADLLRTSVSPSFDQIGKLAAIVAIRTGLNFFLSKELDQERQRRAEEAT